MKRQSIILPAALLDRIERVRDACATIAGRPTRSAVIVQAIERGLCGMERELAQPRSPKELPNDPR